MLQQILPTHKISYWHNIGSLKNIPLSNYFASLGFKYSFSYCMIMLYVYLLVKLYSMRFSTHVPRGQRGTRGSNSLDFCGK